MMNINYCIDNLNDILNHIEILENKYNIELGILWNHLKFPSMIHLENIAKKKSIVNNIVSTK